MHICNDCPSMALTTVCVYIYIYLYICMYNKAEYNKEISPNHLRSVPSLPLSFTTQIKLTRAVQIFLFELTTSTPRMPLNQSQSIYLKRNPESMPQNHLIVMDYTSRPRQPRTLRLPPSKNSKSSMKDCTHTHTHIHAYTATTDGIC